MMRRTPLKPGKPLARTGGLKRKTRLKQRRAKPRRSSRVRDRAHLLWVKTLPCCVCNRRPPSEAHHDTAGRGMGQKADDTRTIPLCHDHHEDAQQYRGGFQGWDKFQMRAWFEEQLARVMAAKEEHVKLTEIPKDDVELILTALEAHSKNLRGLNDGDPDFSTLHKHVEIVATRCDELAVRIRGAA